MSSVNERSRNRVYHLSLCLAPEQVQIESLLDVGCSTGEVTYEMAVELKVAKTYGADIYPSDEYLTPAVADECEAKWSASRLHYV